MDTDGQYSLDVHSAKRTVYSAAHSVLLKVEMLFLSWGLGWVDHDGEQGYSANK